MSDRLMRLPAVMLMKSPTTSTVIQCRPVIIGHCHEAVLILVGCYNAVR